MSEKDMLTAYKTHIRPVVESNSVIIQSMMSAEQSEILERQQTLALRMIYGPGISARKMRERELEFEDSKIEGGKRAWPS